MHLLLYYKKYFRKIFIFLFRIFDFPFLLQRNCFYFVKQLLEQSGTYRSPSQLAFAHSTDHTNAKYDLYKHLLFFIYLVKFFFYFVFNSMALTLDPKKNYYYLKKLKKLLFRFCTIIEKMLLN